MSIEVMTRVWKECPQKAAALLVMLALADWCDDDGNCYPSVVAIAEKARVTDRAAYAILNRLESDGEIKITAGRGRGHTSGYVLDRYAAIPEATSGIAARKPARHSGIKAGENLKPAQENLKPAQENLKPATWHIEEPSLRTVMEPSMGEGTNGASPPAPPGRGAQVYKDVVHLTPNRVQRDALDAAFDEHGEAKMRTVMVEWLKRGHNPKNVAGMLEVCRDGWRNGAGRTNGHTRPGAHPPERTHTPATPEEVEAARQQISAILGRPLNGQVAP